MFRKNKKEEVGKIVVAGEYERPDKGGYDRLRDNALFLNADGNTNVLQIESSVAHEGKTTVACNLAVSLGQTGKKTIVAELDFHRPTAHRVFRAESEGIAGYILGTATKEKVIKHTEFENVDVLPRGGEIDNPSLVLISEKFKNLIAELKKEYDYVILDCAPVLQSSDFIHISKVADGTILLVAYAETTRYQVEETVTELKKSGVRLLGTVFTKYDPKKGYDYYYGAEYGAKSGTKNGVRYGEKDK
mgnify:CR=1 FL=1